MTPKDRGFFGSELSWRPAKEVVACRQVAGTSKFLKSSNTRIRRVGKY